MFRIQARGNLQLSSHCYGSKNLHDRNIKIASVGRSIALCTNATLAMHFPRIPIALSLLLAITVPCVLSTPSFTIKDDRFVLDGNNMQIISGSIHYFRVPRPYWEDRLARLKAMGLNTVQACYSKCHTIIVHARPDCCLLSMHTEPASTTKQAQQTNHHAKALAALSEGSRSLRH